MNESYSNTLVKRSIASEISVEYRFGRHRCPSERCGSELKPTTGLQLSWILLAASKNVPSPPVGNITSAHSILSSVYVYLYVRLK